MYYEKKWYNIFHIVQMVLGLRIHALEYILSAKN